MEVNIHQAKTHFSNLLRRAVEGEEIIIAGAGVPIARLVSIKRKKAPFPLGLTVEHTKSRRILTLHCPRN